LLAECDNNIVYHSISYHHVITESQAIMTIIPILFVVWVWLSYSLPCHVISFRIISSYHNISYHIMLSLLTECDYHVSCVITVPPTMKASVSRVEGIMRQKAEITCHAVGLPAPKYEFYKVCWVQCQNCNFGNVKYSMLSTSQYVLTVRLLTDWVFLLFIRQCVIFKTRIKLLVNEPYILLS